MLYSGWNRITASTLQGTRLQWKEYTMREPQASGPCTWGTSWDMSRSTVHEAEGVEKMNVDL